MKANNFFSMLLQALLLLALPRVHAQDYSYRISEGTVTITDYTGAGGAVTVPGVIEGLPVTAIGDDAFRSVRHLVTVTIPDSVTSIGNSAFRSSRWLLNVFIPDSVTSIGHSAFLGSRLGSITIPDSVTSIGDSAFGGCTNLHSVTIGNGVSSIGDSAFAYCSRLTGVIIPDSVTSIGKEAFLASDLMAITVNLANPVKSGFSCKNELA